MRDFTGERVRRLGMALQTESGRVQLFVAHPGIGEGERLTNDELRKVLAQVSARWNACADALAELEAPMLDDHDAVDAAFRAEQILRRAINGEG
jgi:hypothetical protein